MDSTEIKDNVHFYMEVKEGSEMKEGKLEGSVLLSVLLLSVSQATEMQEVVIPPPIMAQLLPLPRWQPSNTWAMQTKPDHDMAKVKGDCDGLIQHLHQRKGWHKGGISC